MSWRGTAVAFVAGGLGLALLTGLPAPTPANATTAPKKVVAIGDSVMAGFGYYPTSVRGVIDDSIPEMDVTDLPGCRPAFTSGYGYNGSCSANVLTRTKDDSLAPNVGWAPDYGYWNQIAWSSQFARDINAGFSDDSIAEAYRNFALSGSSAAEWADDSLVFKRLGSATDDTGLGAVITEDPDIVTITVGANPTLAKMLFGEGNRCKFVSSEDQRACFKELVTEDRTPEGLRTVYRTVLTHTNADVVVMLYPNIIPAVTLFTAEELLVALDVLNSEIADAVNDVRDEDPAWATRIATVYRQFNTGLPPGSYTAWSPCYGASAFGKGTDGPSNQSSVTQSVFRVTRAVSGWCSGDPWIISGDSGIHPNLRGYEAMSDQAVASFRALRGDVPRAVPVLYFADPPESARLGEPYGPYQFLASGSPLPIFTLADDTAQLPPGLSLSPRGSLGGTPTVAGTYSFRVRVSNGIDDTTAVSSTLSIDVRAPVVVPPPPPPPPPPVTPPSTPLGITSTPGNGSALVAWESPVSTGGASITGYEVESTPAGGTCLVAAPVRTCTITGLSNGTAYTFTVRARNSAGVSAPSAPSRTVTPRAGAILIMATRGVGSRVEQGRITVTGLASGFEGRDVVVSFAKAGPDGSQLASRPITIDFEGRFSMVRRLPAAATVQASVDGVRSNAVVVPQVPRR